MREPIKVAHITTVDMSLSYLLLNQLKSVQAQGYAVTGISSDGPYVADVTEAGVRHVAVPMTRAFTPLADLASLWRLYRVLRRERFTIVHTHNPKPGLLGQLAARMAGVPIVVNTLHGFYFHDGTAPFWRRFYIATEKIAARCSDVILSQNREDIETAVRERICPPERITYLGNGIDVRRFHRAALDPGRVAQVRQALGLTAAHRVVGFVGRLVQEKGLMELLEAARIIAAQVPEARFLFIGPTDEEKADALRPATAEAYGIADRCIFTGRRDDMPELYALMDVFALPSHREGFPRAPMEAAAMEVPCVVTDVRGCRETVIHGHNGLLVPLADAPALAEALLTVLTQPETAAAMGTAGRRLALAQFDEQDVFARVHTTYARLLQEKGYAVPAPLDLG